MKYKKFYLYFFICLFTISTLQAQNDCRSIMGAYFSPIFTEESSVLFASELTVGAGWRNNNQINNGMLFIGAQYSFQNHLFYFEGAFKLWNNSETYSDPQKNKYQTVFTSAKAGPRELYYSYAPETFNLSIGLKSSNAGDYFLMDERTVGINFATEISKFSIKSQLATVSRDFSRRGVLCSSRYLYSLFNSKQTDEYISHAMGETNVFATSITYYPNKSIASEPEDDKDEPGQFEEFDEFDDFEEASPSFGLDEVGLVYMHEFGGGLPHDKIYSGAFARLFLPLDFTFKAEFVSQFMDNQNVIASMLELQKSFSLSNVVNLDFKLGYFQEIELDDKAVFRPTYSNYYQGELSRLDLDDMPLIFAQVTQRFPFKSKLYCKIKYISQLQSEHINETDFEIGLKFLHHFKISGVFGIINADMLKETEYLSRLELRVAY